MNGKNSYLIKKQKPLNRVVFYCAFLAKKSKLSDLNRLFQLEVGHINICYNCIYISYKGVSSKFFSSSFNFSSSSCFCIITFFHFFLSEYTSPITCVTTPTSFLKTEPFRVTISVFYSYLMTIKNSIIFTFNLLSFIRVSRNIKLSHSCRIK